MPTAFTRRLQSTSRTKKKCCKIRRLPAVIQDFVKFPTPMFAHDFCVQRDVCKRGYTAPYLLREGFVDAIQEDLAINAAARIALHSR